MHVTPTNSPTDPTVNKPGFFRRNWKPFLSGIVTAGGIFGGLSPLIFGAGYHAGAVVGGTTALSAAGGSTAALLTGIVGFIAPYIIPILAAVIVVSITSNIWQGWQGRKSKEIERLNNPEVSPAQSRSQGLGQGHNQEHSIVQPVHSDSSHSPPVQPTAPHRGDDNEQHTHHRQTEEERRAKDIVDSVQPRF